MSLGRKERYIKGYNAPENELKKIMNYAKFMLEAEET